MQGKIQAAARALADLTSASATPAHIEALATGLERALPAGGQVPLDSLDWLHLAAESMSLHVELLEASHAELAEWLRWNEVLLTAVEATDAAPDAPASWVLVRGRGTKAQVTTRRDGTPDETREVEFAELAALCGLEGERRRRWLRARVETLNTSDEHGAAAPSSAQPEPGPTPPLRRLRNMIAPDRGDVVTVALFAVAVGVLSLATPIAVQALVNFVALGGALPPLVVVVLLLFLGLTFAGVLGVTQTWVVEMLQRRLFVRVVADLSARLPRTHLSVHENAYAPELVNRFLDIVSIQKLGAMLLLDGLALVLSTGIGLMVLAFYHPLLLAFDVVLLLTIALIVFSPLRKGMKTAKAESRAKYEVVAWLEEIARNPLLYKSSGALRLVFERTDRLTRAFLEHRAAHFRVVFSHYVGAFALQALASTTLLGVGGLLVMEGSLTLGQLVAAELIVTLVVGSVTKLGKHLESFYDLMAATDKVGKLLDLRIESQGGEQHLVVAGARAAELELRGLAWGIEGGPGVFSGVNLHVRPGERVGICGPSGAGKSSLLEILWGLRDPDSGAVRLDGIDLRALSRESLRRSTAIVEQVELFEGALRDNIRLARPFVTDDDMHAVLARLNMLDEIERLPRGLDTEVRASGRPLSRGLLVRLQLARAVAGRPRLLLVSDMFEALTGASRERVFDVLFERDAPWTLLIATNRPDVLARCDRVLRLPDGAVLTPAQAAQESTVPAPRATP